MKLRKFKELIDSVYLRADGQDVEIQIWQEKRLLPILEIRQFSTVRDVTIHVGEPAEQ